MLLSFTALSLGVLATLVNAGPLSGNLPRQIDQWINDKKKNRDLSHLPSVKNKITLYRSISESVELASTRSRIGWDPEHTSYGYGDYNADMTPVLYFFDGQFPSRIWSPSSLI